MAENQDRGSLPGPSHEAALAALLQRIDHDPDFPALSGQVMRVVALADDEEGNLHTLVEAVLRDPGLTQRLLRIVNTAHYRAHWEGVATVTRAVSLLGVQAVRGIALSVVLLDQWRQRAQAVQVLDRFAESLLAAELAAQCHAVRAEREAVFLAALFQGLGPMLVECFLPDLAQAIRQEAQGDPAREARAVRRHLGVSYDELADCVAQRWGFPVELRRTMQRPSGSPPSQMPHDGLEQIRWMGAAGNDLARAWLLALQRGDGTAFRAAARRYSGLLRRSPEELASLATGARNSFRAFSEAFGLEGMQKGLSRWQRFLAPEAADPLRPPPPRPAQPPGDPGAGDGGADRAQSTVACGAQSPAVGRDMASALTQGLDDFSAALAEGSPAAALQALALETLHRAMGARRGVLCLRESDGWWRPCCAIGAEAAALRRAFAVPPAGVGEDFFALLLSLKRDSWIAQPDAPRVRERLPGWYRPFLPSAVSFVVMPLMRAEDVVGLIYLDGPQVRADALAESEQRLLRTLKQLLAGTVNMAQ